MNLTHELDRSHDALLAVFGEGYGLCAYTVRVDRCNLFGRIFVAIIANGATVAMSPSHGDGKFAFTIGYRGGVRFGQPFVDPLDALLSALEAPEK